MKKVRINRRHTESLMNDINAYLFYKNSMFLFKIYWFLALNSASVDFLIGIINMLKRYVSVSER